MDCMQCSCYFAHEAEFSLVHLNTAEVYLCKLFERLRRMQTLSRTRVVRVKRLSHYRSIQSQ
jgi:hypothetical protein